MGERMRREEQILALLEAGAGLLAIGKELDLSPDAVRAAITAMVAAAGGGPDPAHRLPSDLHLASLGLSQQQIDVLRLAIGGDADPVIARKLFLTRAKVKAQLCAAYRRLGATDRLDAIRSLEQLVADASAARESRRAAMQ